MKLSVIVPAYNEQMTVRKILERVHQVRIPGVELEVIVVNDGSKDDTGGELARCRELYTKLITRQTNGGKGAAVKDGLKVATGDFVLFQDADLEYDPAQYSKLLVPIQQWGADVVIGSRYLAPEYVRIHYLMNELGNRVLTLYFNLLYNVTFTDIYSCFLVFRRQLLEPQEIRTLGWQQHGEILAKVLRRGRVYYEVGITYHGRRFDEGKKVRWWHAFSVLWTLTYERVFGQKRNDVKEISNSIANDRAFVGCPPERKQEQHF